MGTTTTTDDDQPFQVAALGPMPQPELTTITSPSGVRLTIAKDAADAFGGLLGDLESRGYKLDQSQTGGYNARPIAGTDTWSQHAYGHAADINWRNNPQGGGGGSDLPDDIGAIAASHGLTWGGNWKGDTRDPMHFELASATTAQSPKTSNPPRAQMADTGTPDSGLLAMPAVGASDDDVARVLHQLNMGSQQPDSGKEQSFISRLGEAFGGGGGGLTGDAREAAGTRSLMNFGMGLLANSGYHPVRTTMGQALAAGLQGAQESEIGSQDMAYSQQQAQRDQVKNALTILGAQQGRQIQAGQLGVAQQQARTGQQRATTEAGQLGVAQGGLAIKQQELAIAAAKLKAAQDAATKASEMLSPAPVAPVAPSAVPPTTTPPAGGPAPVQGDQLPTGGGTQTGAITPPGPPSSLMAGPGVPTTTPAPGQMPGTAGDVAAMLKGVEAAGGPPAGTQVAQAGGALPGTPAGARHYDPQTGQLTGIVPDAPPGAGAPAPAAALAQIQDLPPDVRKAFAARIAAAGATGDPEKVAEVMKDLAAAATEQAKVPRYRVLPDDEARKTLGGAYNPTVGYRSDQFGKVEPIGTPAPPVPLGETPEGMAARTNADIIKGRQTELQTASAAANDNINQLQLAKLFSDQAGPGNVFGKIEIGGQSLTSLAGALGIGNADRLQGQQLFDSVMSRLTLQAGKGLGRMDNMMLRFVQAANPTSQMSLPVRTAMLGYLQQLEQRKVDYAGEVNRQLTVPGSSLADAEERAQAKLGPMVQKMPAGLSQVQKDNWASQKIAPGSFMVLPNGKLTMHNPPAGWEPAALPREQMPWLGASE
jgi:hypothetical protein